VNVRSVEGGDVLAHYDPKFTKPTKRDLASLAAGAKSLTGLQTGPGGAGLDYLRDDLFLIGVSPAAKPLPCSSALPHGRRRPPTGATRDSVCVLHPPSVVGRFNSLIVDFISLFARFISLLGHVGNLPSGVL
jgi:hypothetical protein